MSSALAPSSHVLDSVARSKGVDPTELPPLYEAIDPDALDALFGAPARGLGERPTPESVQFNYAGRVVVVRAADDVEVREPVHCRGENE